MKRISLLLINCFFFYSVILSQEQIKLNPEFYHTWLQYDLYEHLMSGKTPHEFGEDFQLVSQVYFPNNGGRILIGSFYEGVDYKFKILTKDKIEVFYPGKSKTVYVLSLVKINDKTVLKIEGEDKKYLLASLDDKYHAHSGMDYFINDKFFTGNYVAEEDSSLKITFTSDGRITGLNNFNEYRVPVAGVLIPRDFDCVFLYEIITESGSKKVKDYIMFHWKKSDNGITFYNLSKSSNDPQNIGRYYDTKILDKYLTLRKVD